MSNHLARLSVSQSSKPPPALYRPPQGIFIALLALLFFAFMSPRPAEAQTYYWQPGYGHGYAGCTTAGCPTAYSSCQAYADANAPSGYVALFYPNAYPGGSHIYYICWVNTSGSSGESNISLSCPGGTYIDPYSGVAGCDPYAATVMSPANGGGGGCPTCNSANPGSLPGGGVGINDDWDNGTGFVWSAGTAYAGAPVDIATGNVFYQVTDYTTGGQNPLSFTRSYNSRLANFTSLGSNWTSNFSSSFSVPYYGAGGFFLTRGTGQVLPFTLVSGVTYVAGADVDVSATYISGSSYSFTDENDTVDVYQGGSGYGYLQTRTFRNGYKQTMHYTGSQLTSVTDSYSRTLTFTYNTNGTLATLTTPEGTVITYGYTASNSGPLLTSVSYSTSPATSVSYSYASVPIIGVGTIPWLTQVTDENSNNYLSWTYDNYGRALTSQKGNGSNADVVTFSYNDATLTNTVTNALGVADSYTFTTIQNRPKVTSISRAATSTTAAATRSITYDSNGYKASETDWDGNSTTYTNNTHGLPTQVVGASGSSVARTATIVYDATWTRLPDSITTPGLTTSFTYDSSGEVLTKTLTDTTTTTIPYSTNGQTRTWTNTWSNYLLATTKSPNGNTTTFGYNSSGALTSITDALSHVTNITSVTAGGRPLTIVDPNSVTTTLTYSPRQWVTSSAVSGTGGTFTTTYTYDATGDQTKTTLPDGSYIANAYDTAHRLTKKTDALGNYIAYTLDALGDKTQSNIYNSSATLERQHSATFDALGRILTDVGGVSGQTTTFTYDKNGNVLTVKDPDSNTTTRGYDALNRVSTSTDASSGVTTWTYDAHNRPLTITDPNSNATAFVYNGFGNAIQQASPDTGTTVYHYDSDGNLTQKVDAASVTVNATYDALDRLSTRAYPADSTQNVTFTYDQHTSPYGFGIGRLTSVSDAAGCCYAIGYDERGNATYASRTIGSGNATIDPTYDAASRVNGLTYPSGLVVAWSRDAAGNITGMSVTPPGAGSATFATITNAPFGPPTAINFGSGLNTSITLDGDYRITNITASGTATLMNQTYGLDNASNVTTVTDSVNAANTQTLGYDALNRLTSASSGTGGYGTLAWGYDHNGNLTSRTAGGTSYSYSYTSGTNRLAGVTWPGNSETLGYTANGNINSETLNSSNVFSGTYNVANRLAAVSNTPTALSSIVYDFGGQRFSKTDSGGSPITYIYDLQGHVLEETNSGVVKDYIYEGDTLVGIFLPASSTLYYVTTDRIGTPLLVTNSAQGAVWSTIYQPYGTTGAITGSITQNIRLPGQYYDSETTTNYNMNRDYVPNWGRYMEADPIGLNGGLNPYRYAEANPLNKVDPLGLYTIVVVNNNGPVGSHAGFFISNATVPSFIYDPYGHFDPSNGECACQNRNTGTLNSFVRDEQSPSRDNEFATIEGSSFPDYWYYQAEDGPNVESYLFNTTPEQEAALIQRAEAAGAPGFVPLDGTCAGQVSSVLSGIGPFQNLPISDVPFQLGNGISTLSGGTRIYLPTTAP